MCVWCVPISAIILTEVNHLPPNTQGICPTLQNVRELGILRVPRANLELAGWLANFNGKLSIFPKFEKKKPAKLRFWVDFEQQTQTLKNGCLKVKVWQFTRGSVRLKILY